METREAWSSTEPRGHRGEYGFQARIPLRDVAQGIYEIRVEARSGNSTPIERSIRIRVK